MSKFTQINTHYMVFSVWSVILGGNMMKYSQWRELLGVLVESRPSWLARRPSGGDGGADAGDGGGGGHRYPADKRGCSQDKKINKTRVK